MNINTLDRNDKGFVYQIKNKVNGKIYIGRTTRTLHERMNEHARKDYVIGRAIKKYGRGKFKVTVLYRSQDVDILNEVEARYINEFKTMLPNGYNVVRGGSGTDGYTHTDESRLLMSKNRVRQNGKDNPFYGKTHSEETRRTISKTHKCRVLTKEHKRKIGENSYRKVINLDTLEVFESAKFAAKRVNMAPTNIVAVCYGKRKTSGGYRWAHYEEGMSLENQQMSLF